MNIEKFGSFSEHLCKWPLSTFFLTMIHILYECKIYSSLTQNLVAQWDLPAYHTDRMNLLILWHCSRKRFQLTRGQSTWRNWSFITQISLTDGSEVRAFMAKLVVRGLGKGCCWLVGNKIIGVWKMVLLPCVHLCMGPQDQLNHES